MLNIAAEYGDARLIPAHSTHVPVAFSTSVHFCSRWVRSRVAEITAEGWGGCFEQFEPVLCGTTLAEVVEHYSHRSASLLYILLNYISVRRRDQNSIHVGENVGGR